MRLRRWSPKRLVGAYNPECKLFISDPPKGYNDDLSNIDIAFLQIHVPTEDDGTQDLTLMKELITNLPEKKYPASVLKEYYHTRWGIEQSFLFLKYGVALNYFHSIRRDFLHQEIYAKLTLYNFISLLVACTQLPSSGGTKYTYTVSFSDAISIGRLFLLKNIPPADLVKLMEFYKTPRRPGRKRNRHVCSQKLRTLQHRA